MNALPSPFFQGEQALQCTKAQENLQSESEHRTHGPHPHPRFTATQCHRRTILQDGTASGSRGMPLMLLGRVYNGFIAWNLPEGRNGTVWNEGPSSKRSDSSKQGQLHLPSLYKLFVIFFALASLILSPISHGLVSRPDMARHSSLPKPILAKETYRVILTCVCVKTWD